MKMLLKSGVLACSALVACGTTPADPPPVVIEAKIPVAAPCVKEVRVRGRGYSDEEILAGSTYQAV